MTPDGGALDMTHASTSIRIAFTFAEGSHPGVICARRELPPNASGSLVEQRFAPKNRQGKGATTP